MWWAKLKAALGQRINLEGITCSVKMLVKDNHLAIPHVSVPDISYIDWDELKSRGFQGVVFDKDNTLTIPYSSNIWGPLGPSFERCKSLFGNNVAVLSNSAGNIWHTFLRRQTVMQYDFLLVFSCLYGKCFRFISI